MRLRDTDAEVDEDEAYPPVELEITGGYVGISGKANNFSFERMIVYKFGYSFNEQNQYVCNVGCMGSTHLIEEADIDKCSVFVEKQIKYMPGNRSNDKHAIEVTNIAQLSRAFCQGMRNDTAFSLDQLEEQRNLVGRRIIGDWQYNRPAAKRSEGSTSGDNDEGQYYDDWTYSNASEKISRAKFIHDNLFFWSPDDWTILGWAPEVWIY